MPITRNNLTPALRRWQRKVVDRALDGTVDVMRTDPSVPRRTGQMARSTYRGPVRARGDEIGGRIFNTTPQSLWTDEGTRPHIIRARRARALSWLDRTGRRRFAAYVFHPGNRALNWWTPLLTRAWRQQLRRAARRTPL